MIEIKSLDSISEQSFYWSKEYGLLVEARTSTAYSTLTHKTYIEPSRTESVMTNPTILGGTSDFKKEKSK